MKRRPAASLARAVPKVRRALSGDWSGSPRFIQQREKASCRIPCVVWGYFRKSTTKSPMCECVRAAEPGEGCASAPPPPPAKLPTMGLRVSWETGWRWRLGG